MIRNAIVYDAAIAAPVNVFEAIPRKDRDPKYWSDETLAGVRAHIKEFYISTQSSRCCYCNRHLGTEHHRVWDIDHIVPRSTHAWFMFEPRNLAAACVDCNTAKSDTQPLRNPRRVTYPNRSEDFVLLHPHFDEYAEHIHTEGHIYVGKTVKGKQTIYACDLLRFAQKYVNWGTTPGDARFEDDVDAVMSGNAASHKKVEVLSGYLRSLGQPR